MSITVKQNNKYTFMHEDEMHVFKSGLPAGTYTVKFNENSGTYFLEKVESFVLPTKLYGDTHKRAERVLNTFFDRPLSTGVMLNGVKGSGKTLLAKHISVLGAATSNIPTIIVNQPHGGDEFNKFIQSIDVPAIILFDEFEKVYKYDKQETVLTLLDGVFPSKKLFIITTNDAYAVNEHMRNRPGRIYYHFEFTTLTQEFIKEYCEDNLNDHKQLKNILQYTQVFNFFNFDMLAASVEEMNRYGETLQEVLDVLNIMPETSDLDTYKLTVAVDNKEFVIDRAMTRFSPNSFTWTLWTDDDMPVVLANDPGAKMIIEDIAGSKQQTSKSIVAKDSYIEFTAKNITSFDPATNKFSYEIERGGNTITLTIQRNMQTAAWRYDPLAM